MPDILKRLQSNRTLFYSVVGGAILLVFILSFITTCNTSTACVPVDPPIVGEWLYAPEHCTYKFDADGNVTRGFLEDDGYSNTEGQYEFTDGILSLVLSGCAPTQKCTINGDTMIWTIDGAEEPYTLYRIGGNESIIGSWESLDTSEGDGNTYIFEDGQLLYGFDSYAYTFKDGKIYIYDYYKDIGYTYDVLGEDSNSGIPADVSGSDVSESDAVQEPSYDLVMRCRISNTLMVWDDNGEYLVLLRLE